MVLNFAPKASMPRPDRCVILDRPDAFDVGEIGGAQRSPIAGRSRKIDDGALQTPEDGGII